MIGEDRDVNNLAKLVANARHTTTAHKAKVVEKLGLPLEILSTLVVYIEENGLDDPPMACLEVLGIVPVVVAFTRLVRRVGNLQELVKQALGYALLNKARVDVELHVEGETEHAGLVDKVV